MRETVLKSMVFNLRVALQTATIGLEWWNENCPHCSSENDFENIADFKQAIANSDEVDTSELEELRALAVEFYQNGNRANYPLTTFGQKLYKLGEKYDDENSGIS